MVDFQNSHLSPKILTGPLLLILLSYFGGGGVVRTFLISVINLSSIKDSDVRNLRKFEYFYDYL